MRAALAAALGPEARSVERFGLTAVPGLDAKPILGVLVARGPEAGFDARARRVEKEAMGG